MKELIYLFHIQAENGFHLLSCVCPEQLSVCTQVTPDTTGRSQSPVVVTGEFPGADLEVCSCILEKG